jgi:hypothetical protein
MKNNSIINLRLRLLLAAGLLLATTILTACPKEKPNNRSRQDNATLLAATPPPDSVVTLTPETFRGWQKEMVGGQKPAFKPITFTIPDTPLDTLFSIVELNAYAQPSGLGGPLGNLTDEQRAELKRFVDLNKGNGSGTVYINGEDVTGGNDLPGQVGILQAEQDAAVEWVRNALQLRREIEGLSKFKWRLGGPLPPADVPNGLKTYLRSEFERMKIKLTADQRSRLANWRVDFGVPPSPSSAGESLWLKTRENVIWMSPIMLRALLLEAAQQELIRDYPALFHARLQGTTSSIYEQLSKASVINAVLEKFRRSVLFLLAHQMAHVFVQPAPNTSAEDREKSYDTAALQLSESQLTSLEVLHRLLAKASDSTGFEEAGDRDAVLSRLGG